MAKAKTSHESKTTTNHEEIRRWLRSAATSGAGEGN
jgi:hypothetical protein